MKDYPGSPIGGGGGSVSVSKRGLTAGVVTASAITETTLTISTAAATKGKSPYKYQFQRANDLAGIPGIYSNIGTNSTSLSFNDSGLTANTDYWYRCIVTDSSTSGRAVSNPVMVATAVGSNVPAVPAAPSILSTTPNSVHITWSSIVGAAYYSVERSTDGGSSWSSEIGRSEGLQFIDFGGSNDPDSTGLTVSTSYKYRIKAVNTNGSSAYSAASATATTLAGPANPPGSIVNFAAAAQSPSVVRISFLEASAGGPLGGYVVSRSGSVWTQFAWLLETPGSVGVPLLDSGLTPATEYSYSARAFGSGGVSDIPIDNLFTTTTKDTGIIPASHGLMAVPWSDTEVRLSWLPQSGVGNYLLDRSPHDANTWTNIYTGTSNKFNDTGRSAATTYDYSLRMTNLWGLAGTSQRSSVVAATTYATDTGTRILLRPGHLSYVGSFMPPQPSAFPAGVVPGGVGGLAVRYVTGQQRFFSLTQIAAGDTANHDSQFLYEWTAPDESTWQTTVAGLNSIAPYGTLVRYWGNPYHGKKLMFSAQGSNAPTVNGSTKLADVSTFTQQSNSTFNFDSWPSQGLFWDEDNNAVLINLTQYYNVTLYNHPCLVQSILDDVTHVTAAHGPWRVPYSGTGGPNNSLANGGVIKIPQAFADANLSASGAVKLGIGFGGEYSGASINSYGPALFSINSSDLIDDNAAAVGQVGTVGVEPLALAGDEALQAPTIVTTCLMSFHFDNTHYGSRPPGYTVNDELQSPPTLVFQGDTPAGGYGSWQNADRIHGGLAWIDNDAGTALHHGILVASAFGFGDLAYKPKNVFEHDTGSGGTATGGQGEDGGIGWAMTIFDPASLAAVVSGGNPYDPVPSPRGWFLLDFATNAGQGGADQRQVSYIGNYLDPANSFITQIVYDPQAGLNGRIFLMQSDGIFPRPGGSAAYPLVHAYDIL